MAIDKYANFQVFTFDNTIFDLFKEITLFYNCLKVYKT